MAIGVGRIFALAALLAVAGCSSREERAEKAVARYDQLYLERDYLQARIEISSAISLQDDVPEYWLRLARVQLALDRYLEAYSAFQRALEFDKDNVEAIQALAELSYAGGAFDDADKYADMILKDQPRSMRMLLIKGSVSAARYRLGDAQATAEQILEIDKTNEGGTILLARVLNSSGMREEAIDSLQRSIEGDGETIPKMMVLLDLAMAHGNFPQIAGIYAKLFARQPDLLELRLDYIRVLYEYDRPDRALRFIGRLTRRYPNSDDLRLAIVAIWNEAGADAVGIDRLRAYVANNGDRQLKIAVGQLLIDQQRFADAEKLLLPLIDKAEITSERVDADVLHVRALLGLGKRAEALAAANKVLAFDRSNPDALLTRVRISTAAGDTAKALTDAQLLARDNPKFIDGRVALGQVYLRRGERGLADGAYAQAMKQLPDDQRMLAVYLDYLLKSGRNSMALDVARRFTTSNPRYREGWRQRAELCIRLNEPRCVDDSFATLDQLSGGPKIKERLEKRWADRRALLGPVKADVPKSLTGQPVAHCGKTGAPC